MDIWRLDFSVRNGSGRWLDHLIAPFQIEAEWPDCTNWDGPDGVSFAQPIEWADSAGHIQESGRNVVAPGQTLTATKFFIVLRGDPQPRFANWSMDFDFAAGPSPATPPVSPPSGARAGPAGPAASELPPEIQADLHLRQGGAGGAARAMRRRPGRQWSGWMHCSPGTRWNRRRRTTTATRRRGRRRVSRSGRMAGGGALPAGEGAGTRSTTRRRWT